MVVLKSHGKEVASLDESVMLAVLNIYPDEALFERQVFKRAIEDGEITVAALKDECSKLLLPWQLFALGSARATKEISDINDRRSSKFEKRMLASRTNEGAGVSLRIADRLISLQEYAKEGVEGTNDYVGMLKSLHRDKWVPELLNFFSIDLERLKNVKKEKALDYLIERFESKNIRVARGVLTNKILPALKTSRSSYRKSSGFVVRDEKVPYIFLPNEVSDSESPGRQILTLLSLVFLVGLDRYDSYITGDFEIVSSTKKVFQQIYGAASEILLPFNATEKYRGQKIDEDIRDKLAMEYTLTPSAVTVTLRQRGHIDSDADYERLLGGNYLEGINKLSTPKRTPHIHNAVSKMCGATTSQQIIAGLRDQSLSATRAQYLIFGRVDKLSFEKYKANVGL